MVEQDDITFPELTVKQALNFAARLRLPGTDATRQERVDTLIKQMRLDGCCDTRIGGGISQGVSGGERKRVCIAAELISQPTLLFCDEVSARASVILHSYSYTRTHVPTYTHIAHERVGQ